MALFVHLTAEKNFQSYPARRHQTGVEVRISGRFCDACHA
jgi:hypothetical protein